MKKLPQLLFAYEAGDFEALGSMCQLTCLIDEYVGRTARRMRLVHELFIARYRQNVYSKMIALVLLDGTNAFSYTRKEVVRFLRGEFVHGDSDNRDQKRITLHDFAFEHNNSISLEYAVTWSFVIFPGIRSSEGNTDSNTPFVQSIRIENREIKVSQLESIALNAIVEYREALLRGRIHWHKAAVTNNLDAFRNTLGDVVIDTLISDYTQIEGWQKSNAIILT